MYVLQKTDSFERILSRRLRSGAKAREFVKGLVHNLGIGICGTLYIRPNSVLDSKSDIRIFEKTLRGWFVQPSASFWFDRQFGFGTKNRNKDGRTEQPPGNPAGTSGSKSSSRRLPATDRGVKLTVIHKLPLREPLPTSTAVSLYRYTSGFSCTQSFPVSNRMSTWTRTKVKSSVSTVNWKKLKKRDYPFNPYSLSFEEVFTSDGTYGTQVGGWPCAERYDGLVYGVIISTDTLNQPWPSHSSLDTKSEAMSKCLLKVKSMKVNLGQAFGERKQTVNLITKSVNRIVSTAMAVKRRNFWHASNLLGGKHLANPRDFAPTRDNLANYWLEFQYGWRPLLQDIYGSCEQLANSYYRQRPYRFTAVASGEHMERNYQKRLVTAPASADKWLELVDSHRVSKTKVILEFVDDISYLSTFSSLGLTNPLELTWELLPYSFVVDWFIPIGNFLTTLDAGIGLTYKRGMTYTVIKQEDQTSWKQTVVPLGDKGFLSGSTQHRLFAKKDRVVLTTLPTPRFPSFQPSLGISRTLSGISLLSQLFSGRATVR